MPAFFSSPAVNEKNYSARVKRLAALAHSIWGTFGKGLSEAQIDRVDDLLNAARSADEIVFASYDKKAKPATIAKDWRVGLATDGAGETRMAIAIDDGEQTTVADFSPTQAFRLALWLVNRCSDLNMLGELGPSERREFNEALSHAGRFAADIKGVTERLEDEIRATYKKAYEAKHFSSLQGLERKAEDAAERKYQGVIRSLSMAAGMQNGAEKAALLNEVAPTVRKAFGHE